MQKVLLTLIPVILMTLAACFEEAPTPEAVETPTQGIIAATTPTPATTQKPGDADPVATVVPTDTPTPATTREPEDADSIATVAPTEIPTSVPAAALAVTPTEAPPGVLIPLRVEEPASLRTELSNAELSCMGDTPETLFLTPTGWEPEIREEQARLANCLHDETINRLFLPGLLPTQDPLSLEASECVRAAFEVIDLREVMIAGIELNANRHQYGVLVAMTVTRACLTDEEWAAVEEMTELGPEDRTGVLCVMEALDGPGPMAAALIAAQEGDVADINRAEEECRMDTLPEQGSTPGPPRQPPTATVEAPSTAPETTKAAPTQLP